MKHELSNESQLKEAGFSLVAILLVIVIVIGAAAASIYVIHKHNHGKMAKVVTTDNSQPKQQANPSETTDPYADWKTYCDSSRSYCFRYPTTWALEANSDQVTVLSQDKSTEVDYIPDYTHDSGTLQFAPVSVTDLKVAGVTNKIVGGVYLPANEPDYGIVDASLLNTYPLTIGQTTTFPNALRFTDTQANDSSSVAFRARYTNSMTSQADAQAWFNGNDGKTSLQILQSLYHK